MVMLARKLENGSGTDLKCQGKHHNVFQWDLATATDTDAAADAGCVHSFRETK